MKVIICTEDIREQFKEFIKQMAEKWDKSPEEIKRIIFMEVEK